MIVIYNMELSKVIAIVVAIVVAMESAVIYPWRWLRV